jgi:hypothetical protein
MQYEKYVKEHPEVKEFVAEISRRLSSIGHENLSVLESMSKEDFLSMAADLLDTGELETTDASKLSDQERAAVTKRISFLQQARLDIERWYDTTMKTFQDHYERRMKMWAYILSGLVVLWLNANLFEVYREFSTNKVLRELAVTFGERLASTPRDSLVVASSREGMQSAQISDSAAIAGIQANIRRIDALVNAQSFSMMRWNTPSGTPLPTSVATLWNAISRNFFGWIGMTLLVGLGAPFWYDVLRTLVGVKERLRARSGGGSTEERAQEVQRSAVVAPPTQLPPAVG